MRKRFLKLASLALIMALVLSTLVFPTTGVVASADSNYATANLLAGKIPTDFYKAEIATPGTYTSTQIRVYTAPGDGTGTLINPYTYTNPATKASLSPYIGASTDGNSASAYGYKLNNSLVMIYELDELSYLDNFSIGIGRNGGGEQNSAIVKLFTSVNRENLFADDSLAADLDIDWAGGASQDINEVAKYVAVAVQKRSTGTNEWASIREITLTGHSNISNVLQGYKPTCFYAVTRDTFGPNHTNLTVSANGNSYTSDGYTETSAGGFFSRRPNFDAYTALLTDGDESVKLNITTADTSNNKMCIVYELPEATDVKAVEIDMGSYDDNVDVYVSSSNDRGVIFTNANKVGNVVRATNKYTTPNILSVDNSSVKAIGIYVRDVYDSGINEIKVYAEGGRNLILGKRPCSVFPTNDGTLTNSYRKVKMQTKINKNTSGWLNGNVGTIYGYGAPETNPAVFDDALDIITDGYGISYNSDETSETWLGNEGNEEDVVVAYKLDSVSKIDSIKLISTDVSRGTKIYMSQSFVGLFKDTALVDTHTYNEEENGFEVSFATPKPALYVAFVFDNAYGKPEVIADLIVKGTLTSLESANAVGASGTLANNANAYPEAKAFYNYLNRLGNGNGCMLGAEINVTTYDTSGGKTFDTRGVDNNYFEYLESIYKVNPVIVSAHYSPSLMTVEKVKRYYDEGSVPMFAVGIDSPSVSALDEGDRTAAVRYYDATYTPSSSDQDFYDDVQEEVAVSYQNQADFFEALEEAGVKAYIVRPFIEMNIKGLYGNSHWGNDARQNFKNVWQQMYNYFVVKRELKGIIFAFAPCAQSGAKMYSPMEYYPGDAYVDIIAPTCYCPNDDGILPSVADYATMIATGKPFGFSEFGAISGPDATAIVDMDECIASLKSSYPTATFINLWYGNKLTVSRHTNAEEFMKNDYFVTTDKISQHKYGLLCDLNNDGSVNILDLVRLKKFMANASQGVNILLADCDNNRSFGAGDLTAMTDILLGK